MRHRFQIGPGRPNPQIISRDAYGAELWDYYTTKLDKREIAERDDHFIDNKRDGYGGRYILLSTKIGHLSKRRRLRMLVVAFWMLVAVPVDMPFTFKKRAWM